MIETDPRKYIPWNPPPYYTQVVAVSGHRDFWKRADGSYLTYDWVSDALTFYTEDSYLVRENGQMVCIILSVNLVKNHDILVVGTLSPEEISTFRVL